MTPPKVLGVANSQCMECTSQLMDTVAKKEQLREVLFFSFFLRQDVTMQPRLANSQPSLLPLPKH